MDVNVPPTAPQNRFAHGKSEVLEDPARKRMFERTSRRLGERLREVRLEHHLSQEAASEAAGIHAKRLSEIESAKGNVTLATLSGLAVAYQTEVASFFTPPTGKGPQRAAKRMMRKR